MMKLSRQNLIILSAAFMAGWLLLSPPLFLPSETVPVAAFTLVIFALLASGIFTDYLTALIFFTGASLLHIGPPGSIFAGFSAGAFWLIFGGLILGVAINGTGLGNRIGSLAAKRLPKSYKKIIMGLVLFSTLSCFLIPSAIGRLVLLLPIVINIAEGIGLKPGRKGYTGVVSATIFGAFLPGFAILPSNVANMVLTGLSEHLYHYSPLYGEYLLLHAPVLVILKAVIIALLIIKLFPDRITEHIETKSFLSDQEQAPMNTKEKLLLFILFCMLLLWLTDTYHHIAPAWVAMGGACIILLPAVGMVSREAFQQKVKFGSLFSIAAILGLGQLITHSGLGNAIAGELLEHLPLSPDSPMKNFMFLSHLSMVTGIFTTQPGIPAVLTPLAEHIASATHLSLKAVLMTQVVGFSFPIFPFQVPPFLVGMQMSGLSFTDILKTSVPLTIIAVLVLMPLDYFWWHLLGWL